MSLQRFSLYFAAIMACAVVAFPHWAPAGSAASAPLPDFRAARHDHGHLSALRVCPSLRHRAPEAPRLVASR